MKKQSRRRFIKNVSAATLAASTVCFPFISYGRPLSHKGRLGIALVGLGYYSTDLLAPGLHGFLPRGETFDFPEKHQQAVQMDEMSKAIMEGRPSLTPGEEGLRDMVIVDAIKESVKKGGKKINLA